LRIIVITPPGGQADTVARMLSEGFTQSLKRPVVVENKPGAGGNIAAEYVANASPDGTMVLLTSNNHTINPSLFGKINYDYLKSFEPVTQLTRGPSVIAASTSTKADNIKELVALAKAGNLSYGSTGIGSAGNLAFEMLKKAEGIQAEHVPYKGAGPAVSDALGGHVPVISVSLTSALPFIRDGKLKGLAVTTQDRWRDAPNIPTLRESGCEECVYETYLAILAPKGTSKDYVQELNKQIAATLKSPANLKKLATLGVEPVAGSVEDFTAMLKNDYQKAEKVIRETGMTVN
jgi:tripartite-type tricarboxylate transporter receptor subunit TctC